MKYIIRPRGGGKTTEVINEVLDNDGYLLTFSETERRRIIGENPPLKDRVFTWGMLDQLKGRIRKPVYIDNADYWIRELLNGYELGGMTLNLD